ncbi:uncharacterized protein E0L32_010829 [Thyridium curvatum]|uniref:Enoyl reductase (ER) domain-containing protein n=1 Tax=Thyridium curvatum TaxID=1093900 RepID=A0A507ADR6_9PEZI|nr:uncharacterized protein E0L32_010829 [Thyridium curvatum]TPX07235.1 hypothetical protein E0L32_010829 [Thyridium curvatum]
MRGVVVSKFVDNYTELQVEDIPPPKAKKDEVIVQVKAAGVNFVDTLYARGKHQNNRSLVKPPFTLGLEFAGVVLSAPPSSPSSGSGSHRSFKPGDRVFGGTLGSYAEQVAAPTSGLRPVPDGWSFADAAGLAATLPVSYGALVTRGRLAPGETVLVLGAAGGLGCTAVQVAAARGCRVIALASGAAKCAVARRCGAHDCVDATTAAAGPRWWERVLELTGGKGVDVVYDSVGRVDESLKCVAHRGRVLVVGFAARDESSIEKIAMNRVLLKQVSLIGYRYGESLRRDPEENARIWEELAPLIDSGKIKPMVFDKAYNGLESVPEALNDISSRKIWGKAVVNISEGSSKAHL